MNYKIMIRVIAWILLIETGLMIPSFAISAYTHDFPAVYGFAWSIIICAAIAGVLFLFSRNYEKNLYAKEGMLVTSFAWIAMSLLGALPFFLSGRIPNYVDAFFEIVSGFTTTGASVLGHVEVLGKGLLFWRSFSHWIGGMGVLVFFLAVIPSTRKGEGYSLNLLRAESPGPSVNKMVPRMRDSATVLYRIYFVLTILNILFLRIAEMPMYDAVCIAFATAGTGGFAVLDSGFTTYTPLAQDVTTIFMLLFGVNFSVFYMAWLRKERKALRNEELRVYLGIFLISTIAVSINTFHRAPGAFHFPDTIRNAAFQVSSIMTTTGFSSIDYNQWPNFSKSILLCLMFCGACAGSTGGGIKISRLMILFKSARRNLHNVFHPEEVRTIRIDGERVSERTIQHTQAYLALYVFIIIISFLLISLDPAEKTMAEEFSTVMTTLNNVGPGFDAIGPTSNYAPFNAFTKLVLCLDMLLGRLEIYPILTMFAYSTYRKS